MRVTVMFFAQLAEQTGIREASLDLAEEATVMDALDALAHEHPVIEAQRGHLAVAVNESYARPDHHLVNGDTMAIISPVSGG